LAGLLPAPLRARSREPCQMPARNGSRRGAAEKPGDWSTLVGGELQKRAPAQLRRFRPTFCQTCPRWGPSGHRGCACMGRGTVVARRGQALLRPTASWEGGGGSGKGEAPPAGGGGRRAGGGWRAADVVEAGERQAWWRPCAGAPPPEGRGPEVEPGRLARWGPAVVDPPWHRCGRRSALDSGHGGRQRHGWGGGAPQRSAVRAEAWRMAGQLEVGGASGGRRPAAPLGLVSCGGRGTHWPTTRRMEVGGMGALGKG
jgi:hypothetical protein